MLISKYNLDASEEEDSNKKKSNRRSRSKSRPHTHDLHHAHPPPVQGLGPGRVQEVLPVQVKISRFQFQRTFESRGSKSRSSSRSHRGSSPRKDLTKFIIISWEEQKEKSLVRSSSSGDRKKKTNKDHGHLKARWLVKTLNNPEPSQPSEHHYFNTQAFTGHLWIIPFWFPAQVQKRNNVLKFTS